jgi:hypothetical protein
MIVNASTDVMLKCAMCRVDLMLDDGVDVLIVSVCADRSYESREDEPLTWRFE